MASLICGSIAYNLNLLGGEPIIMATVGADATPYMNRLEQLQIDANHILGRSRTHSLHRP